MFRTLFLSLLVYANSSVAPRVPPPNIQEPVKQPAALAGPLAEQSIARPGIFGLVPSFLQAHPPLLAGDGLLPKDAVVITPAPEAKAAVSPGFAFADIIMAISEKHGVDWRLVAAVISVESNFNPRARSHKGARGLMQLVPATARAYDVKAAELYDPARNVEAGVRYLKTLQKRYPGNLEMAIAAYNTGEGAVDRHRGVPPYRVTRAFVKNVIGKYRAHQDSTLQAKGSTLLTKNTGPDGR